jgi:thioesterase domain-containing protein
MNTQFGLIILVILISACSKNQQTPEAASDSDNPNQILYDQVMDVHDEVMPRMDEIMKLKRSLQEQIANTPDMVVERKQQLEKMISNLDSASNAMMDWMHKFNPLPDSTDQEKARAYLESEMERIRNVKTLMLETIDKAKQESSKQ